MELTLDAARWRRRSGIRRLLKALGAADGLTRYVGGAVRDELLGLPVNDIDLATRIRPGEVVERLEAAGIKVVPTGIEHGTVTAVSDGQPVEVTSLRRDVSTDDAWVLLTAHTEGFDGAALEELLLRAFPVPRGRVSTTPLALEGTSGARLPLGWSVRLNL